jgi:quercetin dioxygenase-like cupin family protein
MSAAAAANLIAQGRQLLTGLHSPLVAEYLALWPCAPLRAAPVPAAIPVLRHLPGAAHLAPAFSAAFAAALKNAAPGLVWRRSYTPEAVGPEFWDNYGWTELVGLTGPAPSERLACGLLVLGPHLTYSLHHHEAEEIYVPLSGIADWKLGGQPWHAAPPGSVIHHPSNQSHAMRTTDAALLALYLWRGENLSQKSQLAER